MPKIEGVAVLEVTSAAQWWGAAGSGAGLLAGGPLSRGARLAGQAGPGRVGLRWPSRAEPARRVKPALPSWGCAGQADRAEPARPVELS